MAAVWVSGDRPLHPRYTPCYSLRYTPWSGLAVPSVRLLVHWVHKPNTAPPAEDERQGGAIGIVQAIIGRGPCG